MNEGALREAISTLQDELDVLLAEVREKKQTINALYKSLKESPPYEMEGEVSVRKPKRSQFFGKPFATAATDFLQMRGEPCTAEEITNGLKEGAFDFPWEKESEYLRMVAISLGKNSTMFLRLPNDTFGLNSWYPDRKKTDGQKRGGAKLGNGGAAKIGGEEIATINAGTIKEEEETGKEQKENPA